MKKLTISLLTIGTLFLSGCGSSSDNFTSEIVTLAGKTYKTVKSPKTNKIWLDRNLGASQVCVDKNDTLCFGDYYQWGRDTDGHEKSDSNITVTLANSILTVGVDFIEPAVSNDWTDNSTDTNGTLRQIEWLKTDGTSICPTGYRVASSSEFQAEIDNEITNHVDAFNSFLKIPSAGVRAANNGSPVYSQGIGSVLWSSTTGANGAYNIYFDNNQSLIHEHALRADGYTVRCIKD